MKTYIEKVETTATEFKDAAVQQLGDCGMKQEQIAAPLGTTVATVSRWFNFEQEYHLPAFTLALLPKEFSVPILCWLAERQGVTIVNKVPVVGAIDGKLDDETLEIVQLTGQMIDHFKRRGGNKRQLEKDIRHMQQVIDRAKAEIEGMPS